MKLKSNYSILSFGLMTAATTLLAAGWLADGYIVGNRPALRLTMVTASFAICLAAIWAYYRRQSRYRKVAQRYLDLLCRLDANDVTGSLADVLPTLEEDNPWHSVFTRVSRLHPDV